MRKIAIFTGTRAEYGLLSNLIAGLRASPLVDLHLYVGGSHLSQKYGFTIEEIKGDGHQITECMDYLDESDSPEGIARSMAQALVMASDIFARNKPELVIVLGDRFEVMAVSQAAMIACIPIAHIHGGEITEGLIDEAVRHSVTKMAHLHFVSTETYRKRVLQLGENPAHVFNVGAPGIDNIVSFDALSREELSRSLDFNLTCSFFLITYHPVTLDAYGALEALENLLTVLKRFKEEKFVITYPNADTHNQGLIRLLEDFCSERREQVLLSRSLGQLRYLSLLSHCEMVIGNSSSGLIEAPAFFKPTVNIGPRQNGRLRGPTVIDCDETVASIEGAIDKARRPGFKAFCRDQVNPYGAGGSSKKIQEIVEQLPLHNLLVKSFNDLEAT